MKTVWPDYDRSILSTLSALTGYFGVPLDYPPLSELAPFLATKPRHVMLLLLDGMGGYPLKTVLPEASYLRAHEVATVTSIFPPTTAAATTAYYCGQSALESGWLGWHLYMKEFASDVIAFKRTDYYTGHTLGGPFPAGELIPYETVFERMRGVCGTHTLYAFDSYSEHGADFRHRVSSFADVLQTLKMISRGDEPSFTIAYWNQPDAKMHRYGIAAPETAAEFRALDRQLNALHGQLRDTLLVITADHGMIDTTGAVDIAKTPALLEPLVLPPSIEPRAAAFHVKNHRRAAFEAAFQEICGADFRLFPARRHWQAACSGGERRTPSWTTSSATIWALPPGGAISPFPCPGRNPGTD